MRSPAQAGPGEGARGLGGNRDERCTSPRSPRFRRLLCPAGDRCFRTCVSCCLTSCRDRWFTEWRSPQPPSPGCVLGFLPPWHLHPPPGPLTLGRPGGPLTRMTKEALNPLHLESVPPGMKAGVLCGLRPQAARGGKADTEGGKGCPWDHTFREISKTMIWGRCRERWS